MRTVLMPRETVGSTEKSTARAAERLDWQKKERTDFDELLSGLHESTGAALEAPLQSGEKELRRELVQSLRTIRYGSIVLVMHEGRLVEVSKTVRIRRSRMAQNEKE
jgi:hypothetical protein